MVIKACHFSLKSPSLLILHNILSFREIDFSCFHNLYAIIINNQEIIVWNNYFFIFWNKLPKMLNYFSWYSNFLRCSWLCQQNFLCVFFLHISFMFVFKRKKYDQLYKQVMHDVRWLSLYHYFLLSPLIILCSYVNHFTPSFLKILSFFFSWEWRTLWLHDPS